MHKSSSDSSIIEELSRSGWNHRNNAPLLESFCKPGEEADNILNHSQQSQTDVYNEINTTNRTNVQPPLLQGGFKNGARRKTREGLYNCERLCPKKIRVKQRPRESHNTKKSHLIRNNRDSGDLMRNFSSVHIGNSRLTTMQGSNGLGIFKNGRASSSTRRRGIPDLAYSEMKFLQNLNTSHVKDNSQRCQDFIRGEINQSSLDDCQEKSSYFNHVPRLSRQVNQWMQSSNIEQTKKGKRIVAEQNNNSHGLETDNYWPNNQDMDLADKTQGFPEPLSRPPLGSVLQPKLQPNRHGSPDSIFSKDYLRDKQKITIFKPILKYTDSGVNPSQDSKSFSTIESCQKKDDVFKQKIMEKKSQTGTVETNTVGSMRHDNDIRIRTGFSNGLRFGREDNENKIFGNTNDVESTIIKHGTKSSQHNHTEQRKASVLMNDTKKTPKKPHLSVALSNTCRKVKRKSRIERPATTIPILDPYLIHGALEGNICSDSKDSNTKKNGLCAHQLIEPFPIETSYTKSTKNYSQRFMEPSTPKKTIDIDLSANLSRTNHDENRDFYTPHSRGIIPGRSLENRKPVQASILDANLENSDTVLPSPLDSHMSEALKLKSNNYASFSTCIGDSPRSTGLDMKRNYSENDEPCFISQVQYHHGEEQTFLPQNTCSSNEEMRLCDNIWLSQALDKLTTQGEDIQDYKTGKIQHLSNWLLRDIERDDSSMLCGPEIAKLEEFDSRTTNIIDRNYANPHQSPSHFISRRKPISSVNLDAEKSPQYFGQNILPMIDCDQDETAMVDFWKINRPSCSKDC